MDPLTQGVIGSVGATQVSKNNTLGIATLLGFLSGLVPDLDVFIRSDVDPLLALEFHRQFTHSLFFIPIGGLFCALVFHFAFARKKISFKRTYLFCTLGYATHALIDACTSYGTLLFWPLSDARIAWNTISIIDPVFTLPILIFILFNLRFRRRLVSVAALSWALLYLSFAAIQRERAEKAGWQYAKQRGLHVLELKAKPSFANILVWKVIASTEQKYFVDAVKVGVNNVVFFEGQSVDKLDISRDFPWLNSNSQQAIDIERFRWFSNGYLSVSPQDPNLIIDMRFSLLPNEINGLWGIRLDKAASDDEHIEYVDSTDRDPTAFKRLWKMLKH